MYIVLCVCECLRGKEGDTATAVAVYCAGDVDEGGSSTALCRQYIVFYGGGTTLYNNFLCYTKHISKCPAVFVASGSDGTEKIL